MILGKIIRKLEKPKVEKNNNKEKVTLCNLYPVRAHNWVEKRSLHSQI
jgi:hypothetical protein